MILELKTFLLAMTPLGELRLSIPIALTSYQLSVWSAYLISVFGNIVPAIFILLFLESFLKHVKEKSPFLHNFLNWVFVRNENNHRKKFEYWKELALVILVAIPLPFTGAWTGAICSFIFRIPFKRAVPLIFLGVLIAGALVTLFTLGILHLF